MNCPILVTKTFTPKIIWFQTDVTVTVRILLCDLKSYYLRVEPDLLLFSASSQYKDYYVCLHLFGTVVAEETTHVNIGREIKICLTKAHKWEGWLRLQIEKEKHALIVADPDRLYLPEWKKETNVFESKESFAEYKRRNHIVDIMPDLPSSDENDSEDEIMDELFY